MNNTLLPWPFLDRKGDAIAAEAFETPEWTAKAILGTELLTPRVIDPCCGHGTLTKVALSRGYSVIASDLFDWGYGTVGIDFLDDVLVDNPEDYSLFMNPPFSKAVQFIERGLSLNFRKIVSFQRFAWWESVQRDSFWSANRPARVYCCISRATCWRFDVPPEERTDGTPTTHAWFVWERGHPPGPMLGRLLKE